MNQVIPFNFENSQTRVVVESDEIWFVAQDVARALEYPDSSNPARLCKNVPEEWKGVNPIHTPGGIQNMLCLSEQGLYFFLGRSDKPKAIPFQKKIAGEILPRIRKTGGYVPEGMAVVRKDVLDQVCDHLAETIQEICRLNKVIAALSQPQIDLEQMKQDIAEIKEDRRFIRYLIDKNEKLQRRGTRLSEDERRDIWFKYHSGTPVALIERETGRDASSIRRIIRRGNWR
jgi:prophage antirepressor-like protein